MGRTRRETCCLLCPYFPLVRLVTIGYDSLSKLPYLLFPSIFFLDYLALDLGLISRKVTWLPELISGAALIMILLSAAANRSIALKPKFLTFFFVFGIHILVGIIVNMVSPGAIFAGLRTYLKYLPFFLLPAVYDYSDEEIKKQLKFLLFLAVLQFPVVLYQKFVQFSGRGTGDVITGTVGESGVLSIVLICTIAVLLSFYLRKQVTTKVFLVLLFLLFIPTTLNETKVTVVLLPIALIVPLLFLRKKEGRFKQVVQIIVISSLLFAIFIPVYDTLKGPRAAYGIVEFFSSEKYLMRYIDAGGDKPARVDSLLMPFRVLSDDAIKFIMGLGIGNVSISSLKGFEGEYSYYYTAHGGGQTTVSYLMWELGIVGVLLSLLLFCLIFRDASYLRARGDIVGIIATGWIGVLAVLTITLFYKNIIVFSILSYLFWYLSGYLAAKRYRLGRPARST